VIQAVAVAPPVVLGYCSRESCFHWDTRMAIDSPWGLSADCKKAVPQRVDLHRPVDRHHLQADTFEAGTNRRVDTLLADTRMADRRFAELGILAVQDILAVPGIPVEPADMPEGHSLAVDNPSADKPEGHSPEVGKPTDRKAADRQGDNLAADTRLDSPVADTRNRAEDNTLADTDIQPEDKGMDNQAAPDMVPEELPEAGDFPRQACH